MLPNTVSMTISARRGWESTDEPWHRFAQRRLRQLAAHHQVDAITAADATHPDAWLALQLRPPERG